MAGGMDEVCFAVHAITCNGFLSICVGWRLKLVCASQLKQKARGGMGGGAADMGETTGQGHMGQGFDQGNLGRGFGNSGAGARICIGSI